MNRRVLLGLLLVLVALGTSVYAILPATRVGGIQFYPQATSPISGVNVGLFVKSSDKQLYLRLSDGATTTMAPRDQSAYGAVTTTNNTATTIVSITPTGTKTVYAEGIYVADYPANQAASSGGQVCYAACYKNAGSWTCTGKQQHTFRPAAWLFDCDITTDGTVIQFKAIGHATNTVNWRVLGQLSEL